MVALRTQGREITMTRLVKTLAALALAGTTFAAGPALARITANGVQVNGVQSSGVAGKTTEADSQALRVIGIEFAR
jgi:hypothetical protein